MVTLDQTVCNTPNIDVARNGPVIPIRPFLQLGFGRGVGVACHRGDWRNYVENTLEAVESCIAMGADLVEVDVWRTKDGHLIVMHDEMLDRTSNGKGRIGEHTLAEIRALRLKDGLGNMTDFTIPTVEEVLLLAKDRILVNLDKADVYLAEVYELLEKTGMISQTILKSESTYQQMIDKWGDIMERVVFMPVFNLTQKTTLKELQNLFTPHHQLYEINFEKEDLEKLLFIKKMAIQTGCTLWINTIWPTICGGHSDDRALKDRDAAWGFVIDVLGAGILQTDRPQMMLNYLKSRGDH
ncbi:unnamed protein product [Phytomonas sp. Hart1]|nr:unnamed protein product [Phytomonas sp. Hart1]|eukprot:CCW70014.1 unnamed protein product [Phytomonas sp. isolate Hart1]